MQIYAYIGAFWLAFGPILHQIQCYETITLSKGRFCHLYRQMISSTRKSFYVKYSKLVKRPSKQQQNSTRIAYNVKTASVSEDAFVFCPDKTYWCPNQRPYKILEVYQGILQSLVPKNHRLRWVTPQLVLRSSLSHVRPIFTCDESQLLHDKT